MDSNANDRLQEEVMKALKEIDVDYFRGMQAQMHRCAAACCDDRKSSMEQVQKCVMNCNSKLQTAEQFVHKEFNDFQDRLNRCYMACNDKIKDEMGSNPNEYDVQRYKAKLDKCAENCAETHIKLISTVLKSIKETLSRKEFQNSLM